MNNISHGFTFPSDSEAAYHFNAKVTNFIEDRNLQIDYNYAIPPNNDNSGNIKCDEFNNGVYTGTYDEHYQGIHDHGKVWYRITRNENRPPYLHGEWKSLKEKAERGYDIFVGNQ